MNVEVKSLLDSWYTKYAYADVFFAEFKISIWFISIDYLFQKQILSNDVTI